MIRAFHATDTIGGFLLASMVGTQGHSQSMPCAKGNTVSSSRAGFVDRRDAAMASVLAGGVVVILGYASGIGITPTDAATARPQRPAAGLDGARQPPRRRPRRPPRSRSPSCPRCRAPARCRTCRCRRARRTRPRRIPSRRRADRSRPSRPTRARPRCSRACPRWAGLTSSLLSSVLSTTPVVSDLAGPPVKGKRRAADVSRRYARRPHLLHHDDGRHRQGRAMISRRGAARLGALAAATTALLTLGVALPDAGPRRAGVVDAGHRRKARQAARRTRRWCSARRSDPTT